MGSDVLAIDVGNTNIVLGVFEGERLARSWRLATYRERTADELGARSVLDGFDLAGGTGLALHLGRRL